MDKTVRMREKRYNHKKRNKETGAKNRSSPP